MTAPAIRVLTLIESASVTGPARNLIEFAQRARQPIGELPAVAVTLLTYRRGSTESALAQAAHAAGVPIITINERRRWDMRVLPQLKRVVNEHNPDILETRNVKSHFFVRSLGLHRDYRWVAWNHGYTATSWLDRAYTQLDRWSLRRAYRMVTVCRPFADALTSLGVPREKITILHNSVKPFAPPPPEVVERQRRSLGLRDDEHVVLSVGRLSREKGHADLLRAAAALAKLPGTPPFRIVIVGDGPERSSLTRLASQLGIDKQVTLAGFQRDTATYYSLASVVAVPSHSEGSPNVVLEAMAAGLPIVANSVGGIPEILQDGITGLLVPARKPDWMARAIRRTLCEPELRNRLAQAARARALSDYSADVYTRRLVRFYTEVVSS